MKSLLDITLPLVGTILLMHMPGRPWLPPLVESGGPSDTVIDCGKITLYLTGHRGRWRPPGKA